MSATLFSYDNPDDPEQGILVETDVHGRLEIAVFDEDDVIAMQLFLPGEENFKQIEALAGALLEWVRHCREGDE